MPGPDDQTPPEAPRGPGGAPPPGTGPVRRMPPRWKWAPGTVAITVLCGGLWLYSSGHPAIVDAGAMVPIQVWQGQWWRLITSVFLHGSFFHVAFNVALWWNLGALIEVRYGTARLLALMLVTGVAGSLGQMIAPGLGMTGAIGLSGAVYGVFFFGFLALRPLGGPFGQLFSKTFAVILAGWGLFAVVLTKLDILPVANWAHGLGAITGLLIGAVAASRGVRRGLATAGFVAFALALGLAAWRPVWSPGWQAYEATQALADHHFEASIQRFAPLVKRYPQVVAFQWRYALALAEAGRGVEGRKVYDGLTRAQKDQVPPPVRRIFEAPAGPPPVGTGGASGAAAPSGKGGASGPSGMVDADGGS